MFRRPPSPVALILSALLATSLACGSNGNRASSPDNTADIGTSEDVDFRDPGEPVQGPPSSVVEPCGHFEEGLNLNVCAASYVGGEGVTSGVVVAQDGSVWVAGDWDQPPADEVQGEAEGTGYLLKLSPTGDAIVDAFRVGSGPTSLSLDSISGTMLVSHSAGITALSADAQQVLWSDESFAPDSADIDAGFAVARQNKELRVYDDAGTLITTIEVDRTSVEDAAIHGELGLVFVTGFHQVSSNLQQPFLFAYDFDGERVWRNWDWSSAEAGDLSSDTRGYVVSVGHDRNLYYGGESHGGVTTHFRDPKDVAVDAPLVRRDPYSQSDNWNGAAPLGFVARLAPSTGDLEAAQLLAVRLSSGKGNGVSPRFITAREDGTMLVAGSSACCIEKWDERTVAGQRAMPEYGGGQWVMVLPPDFSARQVWTTFGSDASNSELVGIAAWGQTMAVVQNHLPGRDETEIAGSLVTAGAMRDAPTGEGKAGHVVVFPGPAL